MILIYSDQCKHCNILLETIQRHDKDNIVKKISVDVLRANNYTVPELVHSVPALIPNITDNKFKKEDILYGKQVFDYLLLPNRGALFTQDNNTRLNKEIKDSKQNETFSDNDIIDNGDPIAFSLGSSMSDAFSSLDEQSDNLLKDKVYKWDLLNNNNNISLSNTDIDMNSITPISSTNDIDKLPSLEELLNKRNNEVF